ncbi:NAD+ kinase [Pseudohyphozyma bogoriensis]|nr:NAD+ kinase [Pseudohyphozyma bogoriensis]
MSPSFASSPSSSSPSSHHPVLIAEQQRRAKSPLVPADALHLPPQATGAAPPTSPLAAVRGAFTTHRNVNMSPGSATGAQHSPLAASTSSTAPHPASAPPAASTSAAGMASRSVPLGSPCFVHSHLDNSLSEFIAKKDAANAAKQQRKRTKAAGAPVIDLEGSSGGADEEDSSDTASGGAATDDEEDDEEPSLTRQLAETAVSVREMSKQLGRARVISHIQSVMILTKARDNHLIRLTRELALWLMQTPRNGRDRGLIVYVDTQLQTSKRFDAEGMKRDYPDLFRPLPRRYSRSSSATSVATTPGFDPHRKMTPLSQLGEALKRSTEPEYTRKGEEEGQLRYWNNEMCAKSPHLFDFVVTLGGDGTVLYASWLFQHVVPPIIPFALGSLGFLTCFDFSKYAYTLNNAIDNGIRVNLRMRFTCTVYRAIEGEDNKKRRAVRSGKTGGIFMKNLGKDGWEAIENGKVPEVRAKGKKDKEIKCFSTRPAESFEVLNDLVVDRGPSPYVSQLELFGEEHHMTTVQADGLTVSTPTGSTAYSLSAGGSLAHPEIPAILITPICPHTLSFRPMLLPDSMELRICVPYNSRSTAWASFDGRGRVELRPEGDHIKVTASRYPFPTVCADTQSTDWFNSIARTLKWNERQRQKSFVILEEGKQKPRDREASQDEKAKALLHDQSAAEKAQQDFGDEEDEEEDDDEEDEASDDEAEEEEEAFDIDDLSNPATSASSPVTYPADPNVGHIPRIVSRSSTSSSSPPERSRKDSFHDDSAASSVDLDDPHSGRFKMPPPHPPKLSARHSFNDHSIPRDRSPVSAPPFYNSHGMPIPNNRKKERVDESSRDMLGLRRRSGKSRSRSRSRGKQTESRQEDSEREQPGRAFAVLGMDSDSSVSDSETGYVPPFGWYLTINFLWRMLPAFFVSIPFALVWHHILNRRRSPVKAVVGRSILGDFIIRMSRYIVSRGTVQHIRLINNRTRAYKHAHAGPEFSGFRDWLSYEEANGTAGRWIAPPGTKREDDEVVLYFIHGGGFIFDSGGPCQTWLMKLSKEMNLRRRVQFSVFALDYRLAPEYKYPSQLLEVLAGYHHLVNTCKVSPTKICIAGDSAGGNLMTAFLLHLARPNPAIKLPSSMGPTPERPARVVSISPWIKLLSALPSRLQNNQYDFIESNACIQAALDYVGGKYPGGSPAPSWNPLYWIVCPYPAPSSNYLTPATVYDLAKEGNMSELELLTSSPYVNPSVVTDGSWWKEALPGEGKTLVAWGGKEIFCDDIEEHVAALEKAGVAPLKIKKALGAHDWFMFDYAIPGVQATKEKGELSDPKWALNELADFLQGVDRDLRQEKLAGDVEKHIDGHHSLE